MNNIEKYSKLAIPIFVFTSSLALIGVFSSFLGLCKTAILVIITIFLIFPVSLFLSYVPKGKRIKKIEDTWNYFLEKAKNLYDFLYDKIKEIIVSAKSLRKIVLYLIIINIVSISLLMCYSSQTKNHYEPFIEEEKQKSQKLCNTLFEALKERNTIISELESESKVFKSEKTRKEEKEREKQKRDIQNMSIKELLKKGTEYYNKKNDEEAKKYFEEALDRPEKREEDSEDLGFCSYRMARICRREKKNKAAIEYKAAIDHSYDAYKYFERDEYKKMMAYSAYEAGVVLSNNIEDYENSIEWLNISLEIFKEIGYLEKETMVRHELASAYEKNGDKENALHHLEILRDQYKESKSHVKKHEIIKDIERVKKMGFF